MIVDAILQRLSELDYSDSSRNKDTAEFWIKVTENQEMFICSIIKNIGGICFDAEQITDASNQLERKFLLSGYSDVQVMNIIITDKDIDYGQLSAGDTKFWIVDANSLRLMIFDNQPDDYEGLRSIIDNELIEAQNKRREENRLANKIKRVPWITALLFFANVIVFIVCEVYGSTDSVEFMLEAGALNYDIVLGRYEYFRLASSMFLHFGLSHLVSNMFSLIIVGNDVERWIGHIRFALIYLLSGIGASIVSVAYHMLAEDYAVCAGASGAIYGIFGAMLVMLVKRNGKRMNYRRFSIVIALLLFTNVEAGVDFAAHLGGLIIGALLTCVMSLDKKEEGMI